jgi:hypothetical protein
MSHSKVYERYPKLRSFFYQEWDSNTLEGFIDVDWASDCENRVK